MLQLEAHRQQPEPCKKGDPSWREGVSDAQWAKLDGKRGSKHSQEKHRVEKWFEIWVVLFPDEPRPDTPCKRSSSMALHFPPVFPLLLPFFTFIPLCPAHPPF